MSHYFSDGLSYHSPSGSLCLFTTTCSPSLLFFKPGQILSHRRLSAQNSLLSDIYFVNSCMAKTLLHFCSFKRHIWRCHLILQPVLSFLALAIAPTPFNFPFFNCTYTFNILYTLWCLFLSLLGSKNLCLFFKIRLSIFGWAGSSLLPGLFLYLRYMDFSSQQPLLVQSLGSRTSELKKFQHTGSAGVAPRFLRTGSAVVVRGLSCSAACGLLLTQGWNLCLLHWQILYHWDTREAPLSIF